MLPKLVEICKYFCVVVNLTGKDEVRKKNPQTKTTSPGAFQPDLLLQPSAQTVSLHGNMLNAYIFCWILISKLTNIVT